MTHLLVLYDNGECNCALAPARSEIRWITLEDRMVAWRAVPLLWWDDASYIAYQCRDIED